MTIEKGEEYFQTRFRLKEKGECTEENKPNKDRLWGKELSRAE